MNLGVFGGYPHPNPAQLIQVNQQNDEGGNDMEVDDNVNWPTWNPAVFVNDNVVPLGISTRTSPISINPFILV